MEVSKNQNVSHITVFLEATIPPDVLLSLQDAAQLPWVTLTCIVPLTLLVIWLYYYFSQPFNWVQNMVDVGCIHQDEELRKNKTKTKLELVNEVLRRRHLGDRPPVFPNSWYALLESSDLKKGQVKHIQALGENFAVMRSSRGEVHVLDAYCPHLGANMAVGGVVRGDCLECPFHGWQFRGEDGTCSHIPYSDKVPKSAVVKKWTSKEVNDFVFVWYHAEGDPPSWQVQSIPEIETGKLRYRGRAEIYIPAHIQDMVENTADFTHFGAIHIASALAGSDLLNYKHSIYRFLTHSWKLSWRAHTAPDERHMCTLTMEHTLKLFNRYSFLTNIGMVRQLGPGFGLVYSADTKSYILVSTTPMDHFQTRTVGRVYCPPQLFMVAPVILYIFKTMTERDIYVWSHKKYIVKPLLLKEDEEIARFRRWFSQFYSKNSPRGPPQPNCMDW